MWYSVYILFPKCVWIFTHHMQFEPNVFFIRFITVYVFIFWTGINHIQLKKVVTQKTTRSWTATYVCSVKFFPILWLAWWIQRICRLHTFVLKEMLLYSSLWQFQSSRPETQEKQWSLEQIKPIKSKRMMGLKLPMYNGFRFAIIQR